MASASKNGKETAMDTKKTPRPRLKEPSPISDFTQDEPWRIFRIMAEFVDSFETMANQGPLVRIFGSARLKPDNPYYQSILEMVKSNGFQNVVHFVGFDSNPYKWMKYADCLIIPSRSEANSNVLKEADYLGTPVINTCIPEQMARMILEQSKQFN